MSDRETNNFIEIRLRLLWVVKEKGEILTELGWSFRYPSFSPPSYHFNSTRNHFLPFRLVVHLLESRQIVFNIEILLRASSSDFQVKG